MSNATPEQPPLENDDDAPARRWGNTGEPVFDRLHREVDAACASIMAVATRRGFLPL